MSDLVGSLDLPPQEQEKVDPDGVMHDSSRYPEKDRPQIDFDRKRHEAALPVLSAFREKIMKTTRTPAQLNFLTDSTLLRYLRARDSNLEAAEKMLEASLEWRAKNIEATAETSRGCCQKCEADARSHAFFHLFTDTAGRKVMYSCAARASNKDVDDNVMHMAYEMDEMFGGANGASGKLIWLVDMNGFGLRDLNPSMAIAAMGTFSSHFPERMSQIVLLDAPLLFSGLYAVIFPLLDPVTKNKIVMVSGKKERKKYLDERVGSDVAAAAWIEAVLKLPAQPGSYPPEALDAPLAVPRARQVLERCRVHSSAAN